MDADNKDPKATELQERMRAIIEFREKQKTKSNVVTNNFKYFIKK